MEKLIYVFWRKAGEEPGPLRDRLLSELTPRLLAAGVQRLQLDIADLGELRDGLPQFQLAATKPPPDGMICFWVSSAYRRAPAQKLLEPWFERIAGYAVLESTILPNVAHPASESGRSFGFTQVSFLQLPPRLSFEQWRKLWSEEHTRIGIETQANFRYVQNVVVQSLTENAPAYRGIVEEAFPTAALRDPYAFYDAVGNEEKYRRNVATMLKSSSSFLDFDKLDIVPMSEYPLHAEPEPKL